MTRTPFSGSKGQGHRGGVYCDGRPHRLLQLIKDDVGVGDNWTTGAVSRAKLKFLENYNYNNSGIKIAVAADCKIEQFSYQCSDTVGWAAGRASGL